MPERRFALLMGSTTNIDGVNFPIKQNIVLKQVSAFGEALQNAFGTGAFSFHGKSTYIPEMIMNPSTAELFVELEEIIANNKITEDDLFLFYYFGHSLIDAEGNLCLGFKNFEIAPKKTYQFSIECILSQFFINKGIRKIILILDCCNSGKFINKIYQLDAKIYALSAAYDKYSRFDEDGGYFSQSIVKILNHPIVEEFIKHGSDEFTLLDLFDAAKDDAIANKRQPTSSNNLSEIVLKPVDYSKFFSPSFSTKAPVHSIYNKVYVLMKEVIGKDAMSLQSIYQKIIDTKLEAFQVVTAFSASLTASPADYVQKKTIERYLAILNKLKFASQNKRTNWQLTFEGIRAIDQEGKMFNERLIKSLFNWLEGKELDEEERKTAWKKLRSIFKKLIKDFQIPNTLNFERVYFNRTKKSVSSGELRIILQLMSFTEILKRLDAHTYFI